MNQPAFMTSRGVIRCAYCRDDEYGFPAGDERLHEDHVGIRFKDGPWGELRYQILLDGEDVTNRCAEAVGGTDGRVYLYDLDLNGHRYVCPASRDHAVVVVHRGKVDVRRIPAR